MVKYLRISNTLNEAIENTKIHLSYNFIICISFKLYKLHIFLKWYILNIFQYSTIDLHGISFGYPVSYYDLQCFSFVSMKEIRIFSRYIIIQADKEITNVTRCFLGNMIAFVYRMFLLTTSIRVNDYKLAEAGRVLTHSFHCQLEKKSKIALLAGKAANAFYTSGAPD